MNSPKLVSLGGHMALDNLSQVRGLGRYVNGLREALSEEKKIMIASALDKSVDVFVNPFFNPISIPQIDLPLLRCKKRIAVVHDVIPLQFPQHFPLGIKGSFYREANQFLLRTYNHIVTDSHASALSIQKHLWAPTQKISIIYPFSTLAENQTQSVVNLLPPGVRPQEYVLYVGDVNWHKNITSIAKAAFRARKKLVCVGGAFMKTNTDHPWLKELHDFLQIAEKCPDLIVRIGYVNDNILASLYEHATANILISREEGFGYSYIEAGRYKTPSILSEKPIFHEISDKKGALFVNPENTDALVKAIQDLSENAERRSLLGQEAYTRSLFYSKIRFQKNWVNLIMSL